MREDTEEGHEGYLEVEGVTLMRLYDAIQVGRGAFWFVVETTFFVTGLIMTIGTLIGGYDHEWYVGPLGMVVGAGAAGYFSIWRAMREERKHRR